MLMMIGERRTVLREEGLKSHSELVQHWSNLKITLNKNSCSDIHSPFKS